MRILKIPGPKKPKRGDRWFADGLQFAPDGQKLYVALRVPEDQWIGQCDVAAGEWNQLNAIDYLHDEKPRKPWSPDFSRVICFIGDSFDQSTTMIWIDEAKSLMGLWDPTVMRIVVPGPPIGESVFPNLIGITFSPDGRWLFCAEEWNSITAIVCADVRKLFAKPLLKDPGINRLTGKPLRFVEPTIWARLATLPERVEASVVEVTPDNRLVGAGTTTGDTHLIRVRDGVTLGVLERKKAKRTDDQRVQRLAFSPSGKQLGVIVDGMLRVWDVKTTKLLWDAEDAKAHATDLAYHPTGNTIAIARSDGAAVFLDATSGKLQKRYDWKVGQLNSIAFSPDGLTCAAGGEKGQVVVWDVDS
ncbi:MAG: WD40 repeat domain-containing protein [Gemmataceae bacterium]